MLFEIYPSLILLLMMHLKNNLYVLYEVTSFDSWVPKEILLNYISPQNIFIFRPQELGLRINLEWI